MRMLTNEELGLDTSPEFTASLEGFRKRFYLNARFAVRFAVRVGGITPAQAMREVFTKFVCETDADGEMDSGLYRWYVQTIQRACEDELHENPLGIDGAEFEPDETEWESHLAKGEQEELAPWELASRQYEISNGL